jgi:argininosuccinate lyase
VTLWAGRVGSELAPEVESFLAADDAELLPYDCRATLVHARRLHAAGLLDAEELAEAERVLTTLEYEPGFEDVHTLIEQRLGEVGRKLQAGRSRNDQVAAALRLLVA